MAGLQNVAKALTVVDANYFLQKVPREQTVCRVSFLLYLIIILLCEVRETVQVVVFLSLS
jgi:hypothetical protein